MSIESITEKLKEENEIDQLDKTVESIKISIFKIITEWKDITKSVHTNIKLSLIFYFLFKNKYFNYQTLIKLIKKLLVFVINIFIFVGS